MQSFRRSATRRLSSLRVNFLHQVLALFMLSFSFPGFSQPVSPQAYQDLRYRMIGPFRAGRTVGAVGIPDQPNLFFIGVNNGGVWKTDDYGRTWMPIFDQQATGSVGDIAVYPGNPDIIYVGTGEGLHRPDLSVGDGIFKSTDGGRHWEHIGLNDIQQVGRIIVHPKDPDLVFVAGLGHPYGPNAERGVFRSRDGGSLWEKVLYINQNTGAIQVEFDPTNPKRMFASLWEHREGPWENAAFSGPASGLYRSTDGGSNWKPLGKGLPGVEEGLGRIGIAISNSQPKIMYATVDAHKNGGIYRSSDGGDTWTFVTDDHRLWGRGSDFAEIKVHPQQPNTVFIANVASYRSTDGGKTWSSFKGAPGGDDYHRIWINPRQPDIMLFAADQGATITVNGGRTWSSWYNQPTAQLYHVSTDNQFPYWVYGGQQESGAIGIASRSNGGQISFREFMGVGADEYAYVAADPLNPDIIYGGRVVKFDKRTGQSRWVGPEALRSGKYRVLRTMPLLFHPADPRMLLFATNVLWKTTTGGDQWEIISPDLSREQPEVPVSIGDFRTPELQNMRRRGVIYALGPSPLDVQTIWAGTDDGLVHVTWDGGKHWQNVTPPALTAWDKIAQIDAGHFDSKSAYIAVNAIRKDDMRPHIYRTHDGGTTWQEVSNGMPDMGPVNVVREDPVRPGLLYAGTERTVYFSTDDGDHWQSLQQNLPSSSIRDLVVHDKDLVIGTHGRSIWILDDVTPLRQLQAASLQANQLFRPEPALRVRNNVFSDTPLPPEEPTGQNPPDGAIIDYYLAHPAQSVIVDVLDSQDKVIRSYSSDDKPEMLDSTGLPFPTYWIRPSQTIGTRAGHHRMVWDIHHSPPPGVQRGYTIAAVYHNTPSSPPGPWAAPGNYTIRLTVDGQSMEQPIEVVLDPRVSVPEADIDYQSDYSLRCYHYQHQAHEMITQLDDWLNKHPSGPKREMALALRGQGEPDDQDFVYGGAYVGDAENENLVAFQNKCLYLMTVMQSMDARPTQSVLDGVDVLASHLQALVNRFDQLMEN
ncbi:MAG: glycoside hydrolase [Saprospiraceae bacterium]